MRLSLLAGVPILVICVLFHGCTCMKIIGGKEAGLKPYMVALYLYNADQQIHLCGGTLIDRDWVLTAAHCDQGGVIKAYLGTKRIGQSNMKATEVVQKIQHENYNRTHSNDIMLLKLKKPAVLNNNIRLLGLPENNDDVKPGTLCNVAGWGRTLTLLYSPTLQEVNVTVIDRETCNSKDYYNHDPTITEDLLCACNKTGGGDACQGDSGSPLVCEGIFRGIVSGGEGCGLAKKPGIYVNLNKKYVTWIKEKIHRHNHQEESGNQV